MARFGRTRQTLRALAVAFALVLTLATAGIAGASPAPKANGPKPYPYTCEYTRWIVQQSNVFADWYGDALAYVSLQAEMDASNASIFCGKTQAFGYIKSQRGTYYTFTLHVKISNDSHSDRSAQYQLAPGGYSSTLYSGITSVSASTYFAELSDDNYGGNTDTASWTP